MTAHPEYRSRRTGNRTARRISPCYRHPDGTANGICAPCLRERLSGLHSPAADADAPSSPDLRRCMSVVAFPSCEGSTSRNEPRRKSCDVVSTRSSLCNLFDVDDLRSGSESDARVESKNVWKNSCLSNATYTVIEPELYNCEHPRVSNHKLGESNSDGAHGDEDTKGAEFRTMKEYIDLEFHNTTKKSKNVRQKITQNLLVAASLVTRRLLSWRQNNTIDVKNEKKSINHRNKSEEARNLKTMGRRSCDTNPRFSADTDKISLEEPRASWDGYIIARSIPRLAPMFSMDGPMHSIVEGESSSGHSLSESSSSMRRYSFDRTSSVLSFGRKPLGSEDHENAKLVITEKELKNWHLSDESEKFKPVDIENGNHSNGPAKKTIRWRKLYNVFGFFHDPSEKQDNGVGGSTRDGVPRLAHSTSVVGPRHSCDGVELNHRRRSVDGGCRYGLKGIEDFKPQLVSSSNN